MIATLAVGRSQVRQIHDDADGDLPDGLLAAPERATLRHLDDVYDTLDPEPVCEGPLVSHQDGLVECYARRCPGPAEIRHLPETVDPCATARDVLVLTHACARCAHP
jgi:hypothetical protein